MATEPELLAAAQRGDTAAFEQLVATYRRPLHAHCYRMLGSLQDAEDALQGALLRAWRGLGGFEGRSSLRSWLYRIATNACLRLAERRPQRRLPRASSARQAAVPVLAVGLRSWSWSWPGWEPAGVGRVWSMFSLRLVGVAVGTVRRPACSSGAAGVQLWCDWSAAAVRRPRC